MNIDTLNSARQNILGLIADTLLDTPNIVKIEALSTAMENFTTSCDGECSLKLSEGTAMLINWLQENGNKENIAAILNSEHTALFFLGTYSLGTTASYYLTETHTNKGEPRDKCIEFYNKYGHIAKRETLFDEDSLGVQILFLCALISEDKGTISTQKIFWDLHIKPWLGLFCGKVYETSEKNSFFRAFILITEGYLETDREIMELLEEQPLEK